MRIITVICSYATLHQNTINFIRLTKRIFSGVQGQPTKIIKNLPYREELTV